jgi:hypothetical protein
MFKLTAENKLVAKVVAVRVVLPVVAVVAAHLIIKKLDKDNTPN